MVDLPDPPFSLPNTMTCAEPDCPCVACNNIVHFLFDYGQSGKIEQQDLISLTLVGRSIPVLVQAPAPNFLTVCHETNVLKPGNSITHAQDSGSGRRGLAGSSRICPFLEESGHPLGRPDSEFDPVPENLGRKYRIVNAAQLGAGGKANPKPTWERLRRSRDANWPIASRGC